jgi:hypothetical protein
MINQYLIYNFTNKYLTYIFLSLWCIPTIVLYVFYVSNMFNQCDVLLTLYFTLLAIYIQFYFTGYIYTNIFYFIVCGFTIFTFSIFQ